MFLSFDFLGVSFSDLGCCVKLSCINVCMIQTIRTWDLLVEPEEVFYLVVRSPQLVLSRGTNLITAMTTLEKCLNMMTSLMVCYRSERIVADFPSYLSATGTQASTTRR